MLRPVRTARATTKEEVDAALATADQITVEGDDELLSYAINKAAVDPENRVTVDTTGSQAVKHVQVAGSGTEQRAERDIEFSWDFGSQRLIKRPSFLKTSGYLVIPLVWWLGVSSDRRPRVVLAMTGLILLVIIGGAIWLFIPSQQAVISPPDLTEAPPKSWWGPGGAHGDDEPPPAYYAPPPAYYAPPPASDFWSNLPSLLWPVAAIIAIVALFLIARQAISSGSNVTIQWKVTEKVSGKVVITKVRERAPRQRAA
jgi:hypothetical protein